MISLTTTTLSEYTSFSQMMSDCVKQKQLKTFLSEESIQVDCDHFTASMMLNEPTMKFVFWTNGDQPRYFSCLATFKQYVKDQASHIDQKRL